MQPSHGLFLIADYPMVLIVKTIFSYLVLILLHPYYMLHGNAYTYASDNTYSNIKHILVATYIIKKLS